MKDVVTIFTDGSNDNRALDFGSNAYIVVYRGEIIKQKAEGSFSSSTNNRQELLGIINGLNAVKSGFKIELTSDSEYCLSYCNQFNSGDTSEMEIVQYKNSDLLLRLHKAIEKHSGNLKFHWCRGHDGNEYNEICDTLCSEAALRPDPIRDIGSGIGECPKLGWYVHHESNVLFLEEDIYHVDKDVLSWCEYLSPARKMSKKEITQILKGIGWSNKEIKDFEIDTSYYQKPTYYG